VNYSMPDRRGARPTYRAPASNCLSRPQRMVARKTESSEYSGHTSFCRSARFSRARQSLHRCAQLHRLTRAPFATPAHAHPQQVCPAPIRAATSSAAASPRKRVQFKIQIRMPGSDHLVIHDLFFFPRGIPGISPCDELRFACHAFQRHGFLVRPGSCRVRPQPAPRPALAIFAGHAF